MLPLAVMTRANRIESIHTGLIYVTDPDKHEIFSFGDPDTKIYLRSAAKPILAVALVHSGAIEKFGITERELALICSSHSGQGFHTNAINSILEKIGFSENDLLCGAAEPGNTDMKNRLIKKGKRPSPLHNSCSGKHSGILALCRFYNFPPKNYLAPDHPVRLLLLQTVAELLECETADLTVGVDNCGLPAVMFPLKKAAGLYSLLAAGSSIPGKYRDTFERIQKAMIMNPRMVCGDKEFCTELNAFSGGRVIGKVGADGVYCVAVPEKKIGICLKISGGSELATYPVITRLLYRLGVLNDAEMDKLKHWTAPEVCNDKGECIGYAIPVFDSHQTEYAFNIGDEFEGKPWTRWQS